MHVSKINFCTADMALLLITNDDTKDWFAGTGYLYHVISHS
jgi:hypothetical protein